MKWCMAAPTAFKTKREAQAIARKKGFARVTRASFLAFAKRKGHAHPQPVQKRLWVIEVPCSTRGRV